MMIWGVAWFYHFPPDKIWNMYVDEIIFWDKGISEITKMLMPE